MQIFATRKDLNERIDALDAERADLESQLSAMAAERDSLKAELTDKAQALADALASVEATNAELVTAKAELEMAQGAIEAKEAELATFDEKVNERVTATLAASGHPPVAIIDAGGNDADILRAYDSMTGVEKTKFFKANADAIRRANAASK